ncbi:MAG: formate dehydrogenase accessory sulfurtransferase FdhD [Bacteroidetes bacterium]|nr:formate dehydrogenase accessory sulfurtransferase FdhD [Bacteroidota bacterium]MBV6460078.1 Sulfur carrier protein FdhD [Flavobacteriales bacterium]WKZ73952.1 MAG: formate dehydrogenase accessory sulfurtransferase FdhD [Vicingaceae bacterium]MCL4816429.1 formate dehydrogenase accessory sulfurtransferase FdhD [Flavobacteriales bacterium]NOG95503.1 formate dehydrogenase accessory sulfurtransferase FdhD [Bacteroidota bacterium]
MSQTPLFPVTVFTERNQSKPDLLAIEEPLEIRLGYGPADAREQKCISVTMRTPGNDEELALGFLFSEGIITHINQIESIKHCIDNGKQEANNIIRAELKTDVRLNGDKIIRNFYTHSSCGVCGKSSIDALDTMSQFNLKIEQKVVSGSVFFNLSELTKQQQTVFKHTGALHAAAFFSFQAELLGVREDIGRHNALDKLIGNSFIKNELPAQNKILWLSGRLSFELIQKAYMAAIPIVVAVGAPSSLSVQLAQEKNITLIGFLNEKRFNVYTHPERIAF